ncbi:hypothetical protein [Streptosporangium sp. 'caverna']|uniref:hypothetical protein n=1 Tax=Streptosporangium sp. 'caverna' TaxID=2202249 RepID=UPI0013A69BF0|nr:hypothetical protein [Streptosporangium sp. 'caverna']
MSEIMKLLRSAGKAVVAERANRRLLRDSGLTASNGRAVPPVNPFGFALMDSHRALQATP